jgi:hypothetical protein
MGLLDAIFEKRSTQRYEPNLEDLKHSSAQEPDEPEPEETESDDQEPEEVEEVEEPDEPVDLTTLARVGSTMTISDYMDSDYDISLKITPNISGTGIVSLTCDYSEVEDKEDIKELFYEHYTQADITSLKAAILKVIKLSKKLLKDQQEAFDALSEYLDEIEDQIDEE